MKSTPCISMGAIAVSTSVFLVTAKSSVHFHVSGFAPQHAALTAPSTTRIPARTRKHSDIVSRHNRRQSVRWVSSVDEATEEETGVSLLREEFDNNLKQAEASSFSLTAKLMEKIGTVDESRIVFPEIESGEVTRLFSNLEYDRSNDGQTTSAVHMAGSTVGAAALIAGTAIGAGVLALPAAAAPAGFLPSSGALLIAWGYMVVSGLLISELALNRIGETGRPGVGLLDIYKSSLGPGLSAVASVSYFFLHYAVLTAIVAQGGGNIDSFLASSGVATFEGFGQISLVTSVGLALYSMTTKTVNNVNNLLVAGVAAAFLGIMGTGAGSADFGALVSLENQHPEEVVNALPILFLSLVYHNVVPTIVTQLEGDKSKITKAIVGGTAVPLLMLLAWNAVVLGNVIGTPGGLSGDLDPVAVLQNSGQGGEVLGTLVTVFSELAVVTSIIGFVYGLVDALTDVAGLPTSGPRFDKWKPALYAGVLVPPVAVSLANPDIFYTALDYGGAFGVSTFFLVLPPIMVWQQRYGEDQRPLTVKPMVPFGKIPLGSLWKAAATLIVEQGAEKLGIISYIENMFSNS
mmetsp:Transcript_29749/g.60803  ORF Transcript_29749/g.60803 Transcript_29749/m.60803 type:complete len:575 (-) Transcript_29749:100-1824(-)|eukprot:CAMPEP_0183308054 /NCGR_PEP_ID=MMETSP0160_2-20130417/19715_1 /TAXON_ID=2839 ORGANISM="Odontella Sinensis, Strain Grunow 1884" /NCGR_SAMPLE_ID=MMETSP0160_2 /ASSEMBLY_ACC=CAM_ASM_000250 /LENGTH=574 /DNA_ID=CAMNT_0025471799 /DNA_START=72 /DNA_END=1796 /DNA_ORIENTATION=-